MLGAQELCQTLEIAGATAVAVSNGINGSAFVACYNGGQSSIQQLVAVPLDQQAEALADLSDFLSALEIASLLPESQVRLRLAANSKSLQVVSANFRRCNNKSPDQGSLSFQLRIYVFSWLRDPFRS